MLIVSSTLLYIAMDIAFVMTNKLHMRGGGVKGEEARDGD